MVEHILIAPDGHEMIADPVTANLLVSQHGYKHKEDGASVEQQAQRGLDYVHREFGEQTPGGADEAP